MLIKESLFTIFVCTLFLLFHPVGTAAQHYPASSSGDTPDKAVIMDKEDTLWLDSLTTHTPIREKIAQLFIVPAYGNFTNKDSRSYRELTSLVEEQKIGGIIFMQGDIYGQAVLTNKLQRMSKTPLWITQDMEYGAAMRVSGTTRFTPAMGIAASTNKRNAFMMGKITALEAKALGVHQIYAPVLDVNNNPDNPVINVRSFSANPDIVSGLGTAFIRGVQSEGIVATAKHFPGHGDTDVDSHSALPVVDHDYSRLDSLELVPFRAAIDGGINSIMSAHIAFPTITTQRFTPGTLDRAIIGDLLIDSLSFKGLIVTDGLEMRGISSTYSPGEAVVKALKAGADIMLISPDVYTAINEIEAAIRNGQITENRINTSFRKLLGWKKNHGLFELQNQIDIAELDAKIRNSFHQSEANRIARESITLLKNEENLLPLRPTEYPKIAYVSIADDESGSTGSSFVRYLRQYHPDVSYHLYDNRTTQQEQEAIIRRTQNADLVIIGSFVNLRYLQSIKLSDEQHTFLERLQKLKNPSALISFGNPYVYSELPNSEIEMLGWYNSSDQLKAVAAGLFGASAIQGELPINIPGYYTLGSGLKTSHTTLRFGNPGEVGIDTRDLYKIDDIIDEAIRDSVFPGAVVGVMKDGVLAYSRGYGYQDYSKLKQVKDTNVFDLASITKVVSTTTAAMKLIDQKQLSLEDKVSDFISEFDTEKKREITIGDLLLHQSGLPPFRVYVDSIRTRAEIINAIKHEPLTYEPGTDYVYSDLGMILLAEIVGQLTEKRIDRFMRDEFYYPMNMYSTYFNPADNSSWLTNRISPTEIDTVYDRGLVHARVHDERAYYMDGIAGHAGLFSSVTDLAKYSMMLLNGGSYGGVEYLKPQTIKKFTTAQSEFSGRGYGFDRKSVPGFTTAGQLASEDTFGHLGFTGTSLWIDREKNMAVILLTNRTFPYRSYGKRISKIRARVADAAFSATINK
ncbi:MAG: hypothetical protein FH748_09000 [Balneolaceae bacterium]|nr:hypothetical protein [Balneolaceae bacterium]